VEQLSFGPYLGAIMQVAYVVEDIEREMQRWTHELGIGPFFYLPHFPVADAVHRGRPSEADIDVALTFSGAMCFELIRQNNRAPSVFRELIDSKGYGFHHWAVSTKDFDAELQRKEKAGGVIASSCRVVVGARNAFVDTTASLGGMLEVIEVTPAVEEFFGMLRAASQSWDGSDPIRVLGPAPP
jgi:Glyoxalase/Bleomycin resistance protein/Dioxygenase superfamily